jgi:hypothetical protein
MSGKTSVTTLLPYQEGAQPKNVDCGREGGRGTVEKKNHVKEGYLI